VQAVKGEQTEREIVVDTAVARVVLTNRGGRVLHWQLKDYRTPAGELVDLVPSNIPADQPRPFSLRVDDPQVTQRLDESLYQVRGDTNGRVDATKSSGGVTFEFEDAAGLRVRKELRFEPRNFVVSFSADVHNGEMALNPWIAWGPGLGDLGAMSSGGSYFTGNSVQPPQAIFHRDGDVERLEGGCGHQAADT
jgi:YidC/Oxa1 family membrane protein insertase